VATYIKHEGGLFYCAPPTQTVGQPH